MNTQDGWTTSSTVTSDLLKRPYGEIKSDAKLLTRPSRHAVSQRTSNCHETLWPVEQVIKRTVTPLVRTARPTRHSRQSQQPLQLPEHTQKQPRPRQSSAEGSRPTQQLQPPSRPQPRRQPSKLPRSPQENLTTIRQPSRRSRPQGLSQTEMAYKHDNTFEHWLGPPLPILYGVQESRQSRRQSQQISDKRVRQSQQISNQPGDRTRHPSSRVSSNQARRLSAQQIPRSSQQTSADFSPRQRRQSDKSAGSDSNSSSESYIELSPARRREIIIRVNDFVMTSMLSDKVNNVQWKPKFEKKDITYYVDETSVKPGQTRFCCVSRTHATVDQVMKLFVVSDADSMARNKRILLGSLLETQVLSILRRPTKERPMNSMYVQYTSCRSPCLMVDREVCIAVATDMIHQPDGSTIGYCLWETVDGPEFAKATNKSNPIVMFRSGFFFRRSGRRRQSTTGCSNQSYTKIVYMVGLEPGGWAPGLTTRLLMEKFGATVTRLCSHFRRKQLDSRTFVMKTEWASKMSAKSCNQCERQLQVLSNRVNCHSCGHVVCRSCVSKELVELHAIGLVPMYICFSCLEKVKLPTCTSSQKTQSSLGRRRLQSDTTSILGVTTRQTLSKPQSYPQTRSVLDSDLVEDDDDEDSDTGEWAFTPSGVPIRPYRMDRESRPTMRNEAITYG